MIPYLTIRQRIIAWLLWRFERFDSMKTAELKILDYPELLRCSSLLRNYWYVKRGERRGDAE